MLGAKLPERDLLQRLTEIVGSHQPVRAIDIIHSGDDTAMHPEAI